MNTIVKLKWLPIFQCILLLPATLNRLISVFGHSPYFYLMLIQTMCDASSGITCFIIYILLPNIKHSLKICYSKLIDKNKENTDNASLFSPIQNTSKFREKALNSDKFYNIQGGDFSKSICDFTQVSDSTDKL